MKRVEAERYSTLISQINTRRKRNSFSYSLNYITDRYELINFLCIVNTDTCNIIGERHQNELTRETSRRIPISVPTSRGTIREVWVILNRG